MSDVQEQFLIGLSSLIYTVLIFSMWLLVLGGTFEGKGRTLVFGTQIYEFPFIYFSDKTIIDGAQVSAHMAVGQEMTIGPVRLAGIIHETTFVSAGAILRAGEETRPMRFMSDLTSVNKSDDKILQETTRIDTCSSQVHDDISACWSGLSPDEFHRRRCFEI